MYTPTHTRARVPTALLFTNLTMHVQHVNVNNFGEWKANAYNFDSNVFFLVLDFNGSEKRPLTLPKTTGRKTVDGDREGQ